MLQHHQIILADVSFSYASSTGKLISGLSAGLTRGWTGVVGPNGCGKTTLLKLATGMLAPDSGTVSISGTPVYCRQRTDTAPKMLAEFLNDFSKRAIKLMARLKIEPSWQDRWETLSHGERKSVQLACALYRHPDILAIDEPTNHLDRPSRQWVAKTLVNFQGVGLLVSHDRELLDRLCRQCIFIDPPNALIIPGNYTQGRLQKKSTEQARNKRLKTLKQQMKRLNSEQTKRRRQASEAGIRTSKKRISSKDHDAKARLDLVKVSGKDGSAGKKLNQISGRISQLREKIDSISIKKQYKKGIILPGKTSKRNTLFHLKKGCLPLSRGKKLCFDDVYIRPRDKIGISGANGFGKSRLIEHIIQSIDLHPDAVFYLPQEIDTAGSLEKIREIKTLPGHLQGNIMTILSRLGSRPDRLIESVQPSPGEIRKILIAQGIAMVPELIIMDEPTNHLDLPSVECLESALSENKAALLFVSHDHRFLQRLTRKQWEISSTQPCCPEDETLTLTLNERLV